MRLWHKELIPILPRQQLIGQWRECCLIAKNIAESGKPNHILVDKIMDYPISHFYSYTELVFYEMIQRGYKCDWDKFYDWYKKIDNSKPTIIRDYEIFKDWHNDRYYRQCFYNLQEKYDCGVIPINEFKDIACAKRSKI